VTLCIIFKSGDVFGRRDVRAHSILSKLDFTDFTYKVQRGFSSRPSINLALALPLRVFFWRVRCCRGYCHQPWWQNGLRVNSKVRSAQVHFYSYLSLQLSFSRSAGLLFVPPVPFSKIQRHHPRFLPCFTSSRTYSSLTALVESLVDPVFAWLFTSQRRRPLY